MDAKHWNDDFSELIIRSIHITRTFFNISIQLYIWFFIKFSELNFTELAASVKDMVMDLMI